MNSKAPTSRAAARYIGPVRYEDLIAANRATIIDAHSAQVLEREQTYIKNWRSAANRDASTPGLGATLSGLAVSGGGIRSATFALGVTQAFAARDLMRRFDYLSTVSGGGYLGSSLTWLTRPANARTVGRGFTFGMDRDHFPYPVDAPDQQTHRRADPAQDAQLIYLRQHGQYLTPGRGIDMVSAIAVVLRGLLLNLLVWLPIAAILLLLLMIVPSVDAVVPLVTLQDRFPSGYGWVAVVSVVAALAFGLLAVVYSLMTYRAGVEHARRYRLRRLFETKIRYVLWTLVATLPVALMPMASDAAQDWLSSLGFASLVSGVASAVGVFLRSRSGSNRNGLTMSVGAPLGAILFLYGLLIVAYVWAARFHEDASAAGWLVWAAPGWFLWGSIVLLVIAVATGHFVNVNLISVHRYYRDRLMEAFLPDPPAVSPDGHIAYHGLAEAADIGKLHTFAEPSTPTGPYQLLNTNVILVDSQERNWQVRGGDSFVLSPLLCGSNATGWCSTKDFLGGDLTLATAMAISGAAANPYAGGGLFRNRPVALLMSLVNLRLGYWVGHPNVDKWKKKKKRRTHFSTAWRELSGKLSEDRPMLQLSDGGHFDNLGIYELIRRRVRLIIACDGTADPEFGFSDFITLLARIEADFGARIVFDPGSGLEVFMPTAAAGFPRNTQLAQRGFTVGTIRYSDGSDGHLIYVTTTLFSGLPLAALGYKAANPDFPDQTTADQFFDEAQFEAYRHLGFSVGEAVLQNPECCAILNQRLGFVSS